MLLLLLIIGKLNFMTSYSSELVLISLWRGYFYLVTNLWGSNHLLFDKQLVAKLIVS